MTGSNHHGFTKRKLSLTNLIGLYSDTITLVNKERPVDANLDFSKAFKSVCHSILIDKRMKFRLNKCTVRCLSCLLKVAQRPAGGQLLAVSHRGLNMVQY